MAGSCDQSVWPVVALAGSRAPNWVSPNCDNFHKAIVKYDLWLGETLLSYFIPRKWQMRQIFWAQPAIFILLNSRLVTTMQLFGWIIWLRWILYSLKGRVNSSEYFINTRSIFTDWAKGQENRLMCGQVLYSDNVDNVSICWREYTLWSNLKQSNVRLCLKQSQKRQLISNIGLPHLEIN